MTLPWRVESATGPTVDLLHMPAATERSVRFLIPDDRAVVLGSTQLESDIDRDRAAATGTSVLRRRSGGGAVLVGPSHVLWTDVVVPADDPLWQADVGRASWWLGEVWGATILAAGVPGAEVWRGGLVRTPWSDRICFAGLGPGEVTVEGAKVVGLSQRRTRVGAQFQCAALLTWDPAALLAIMALDPETRSEAARQLAGAATGLGADAANQLMSAFVRHLP